MALTIDDIRNGAFLSNAAYQIGQQTAADNLKGSGWEWIDPAAMGLSADANGFYSLIGPLGGLHALIARNLHTGEFSLSFRGTDLDTGVSAALATLISDAVGATYSFLPAYLTFVPLITAFLAYTGTDKVLITGHSLGGALAEEFMALHADPRFVGVTFGSPGTPDGLNNPGSDERLLNFGHSDVSGFGDPVFRATFGEKVLGSDLHIVLPEYGNAYPGNPVGIAELLAHAKLAGGDLAQHSSFLYKFSADKIADELALFATDVGRSYISAGFGGRNRDEGYGFPDTCRAAGRVDGGAALGPH